MSKKEVIVSISLDGENIRIGKLWFHLKGKNESSSFEYSKEWLTHPNRFAIEPALNLTEGVFHTRPDISLFGSIGDSSPDRWGRVLMRRFESSKAKKENRTPRTLFEIDYLLGVNDEARQGALRFSVPSNDNKFLCSKQSSSIPPLIELPRLLSATERYIADDETDNDLRLLLAPGSSLGGARPKASIKDRDGSLAIAKFPRKDDEFKVVLWEAVTLTLAKKAGIRVPSYRIENILGKHVLIIKRFDRGENIRIPFISAMSMLGAKDNEQHSYLEIAHALIQYGLEPTKDLNELWRRIVFTIMVSNTDDHLRNHGFLYENGNGWRLSPAYDINPTPIEIAPHILTTFIDYYDNNASLDTAISVTNEFRLTKKEALSIITEIRDAVKEWRTIASTYGLSKKECDRMASAFQYK